MPWSIQLHRRRSSLFSVPSSHNQLIQHDEREELSPEPTSMMSSVAPPMSFWTVDDLHPSSLRLRRAEAAPSVLRRPLTADSVASQSKMAEKKKRRRSLLGGLQVPKLTTNTSKLPSPSSEDGSPTLGSSGVLASRASMSIGGSPTFPTFKTLDSSSPSRFDEAISVPPPAVPHRPAPSRTASFQQHLPTLSFNLPPVPPRFLRRPSTAPSSPVSNPFSANSRFRVRPTANVSPTSFTFSNMPPEPVLNSESLTSLADASPDDNQLSMSTRAVARKSTSSSQTTDTITPSVWHATGSTDALTAPNTPSPVNPRPDPEADPVFERENIVPNLAKKSMPSLWRQFENIAPSRGKSQSVDIARPSNVIAMKAHGSGTLKRNNTVNGGNHSRSDSEDHGTQRLRNVWRARKMAQVFGSEPPKELLRHTEERIPPVPYDELTSSFSSSPATSAVVTPCTSLDFGRPVRHVHDDTSSVESPYPPTSRDRDTSDIEEEEDDLERSEFRLRRLRAQKLTRFFGTPLPNSVASALPPPENILPDPVSPTSPKRPDTPWMPPSLGRDSFEDESGVKRLPLKNVVRRPVDEWKPEEMQEVLAKLRKLR